LSGSFNTLALRAGLSGNPTFREFLAQVRGTTPGAHAHQDVPFERPVEELQPERDANRTPLSHAVFGMGSVGRETLELPGMESAGA
jgi:non-ribosomal peptide synthetase component F